jgi:hypothetical protein
MEYALAGYHETWATPAYLVRERAQHVFVPDALRRCVVFLGLRSLKDERFQPKATGFLVTAGEGDFLRDHLVTAEHVVVHLQGMIQDLEKKGQGMELAVRLNMDVGGSETVSLASEQWWFHPDNENNPTDVAAIPFSFNQKMVAQAPIFLNHGWLQKGTREELRKRGAALGQEIAIVGLFRHHMGADVNVPIVRIGNISAMPLERVWTKYCGYTDAFLVEARSISGLSGSPAFLNLTDAIPLPPEIPAGMARADNLVDLRRYLFFGLMHGHWDLPNLTDDAVVDEYEGRQQGVNVGIGVVIPAAKIAETLYQPDLVEMRMALQKKAREGGATPDFAPDENAPPATDANPTHREDFNSLRRGSEKA